MLWIFSCVLALSVVNALVADKIVGGSRISSSTFNATWPNGFSYFALAGSCTATVFSSRWFITAAHCWIPSSIRFGAPNPSNRVSVDQRSCTWIERPEGTRYIGNKDIMLCRTTSSMSVREFAWVHGVSSSTRVSFLGQTGTIAGWGSTSSDGNMRSTIRRVDTDINSRLRSSSDRWRDGAIETLGRIDPNGARQGDRVGHCIGDSGGALVFQGRVIGVTSYVSGPSSRQCEAGRGGFSDTWANRAWVKQQLGLRSTKREEPELRRLLNDPSFVAMGPLDDEVIEAPRKSLLEADWCASYDDLAAMYTFYEQIEQWRKVTVETLIAADKTTDGDMTLVNLLVEFINGDTKNLIDFDKWLFNPQSPPNPLDEQCISCMELNQNFDDFFNDLDNYMQERVGDSWTKIYPYSTVEGFRATVDSFRARVASVANSVCVSPDAAIY